VGVTDGISTEVIGGELRVSDPLVTEMIGATKSGPGSAKGCATTRPSATSEPIE